MTTTRRWLTATLTALVVAGMTLLVAPGAQAATKAQLFVGWLPSYAVSTTTVKFTGEVYPAAGQKVRVQRRDGSRWVTVDTATVSRSTAKFSVAYKAKPGTKKFRLLVAAGGGASSTSRTWTTRTTDGVKYKKYIAKARSYMKAYCPKEPIYINTPPVKAPGAVVGLATETYYGTSSRTTWVHEIHIQAGLSPALLRHVALHECAHVVQYRRLVKGATYRAKAEKATAKVYGTSVGTANEMQADCMAIVITHKSQYGGYTHSCGGKRGDSARALWKAWGKKYQKPVYTFATKK
ncbi:hypothetical protein [Cellulomonas sp. HZM]|uniref:hypothetical protein n=1 Tax=Cellulomonas sp. HZM TaxID=1454010 RepID=UPI0004938EC0|nr:hypothetical protein [Cellulomonas sp. HZM]